MENDIAPDVQAPMAKLQGSHLQQTETGWSNVTVVCIVNVWRSQQGWTGPWRSWDDRSGPGNASRHVHWKEHFDPLPVSDLYLTFCEQQWANGWKWCNPQSPKHTHTHTHTYTSSAICLQQDMLHCLGKQEWESGYKDTSLEMFWLLLVTAFQVLCKHVTNTRSHFTWTFPI